MPAGITTGTNLAFHVRALDRHKHQYLSAQRWEKDRFYLNENNTETGG
jgi:hypothetical protein